MIEIKLKTNPNQKITTYEYININQGNVNLNKLIEFGNHQNQQNKTEIIYVDSWNFNHKIQSEKSKKKRRDSGFFLKRIWDKIPNKNRAATKRYDNYATIK